MIPEFRPAIEWLEQNPLYGPTRATHWILPMYEIKLDSQCILNDSDECECLFSVNDLLPEMEFSKEWSKADDEAFLRRGQIYTSDGRPKYKHDDDS